MTTLRPLTTLENSTLTITVTGEHEWRVRSVVSDLDRMLDKNKFRERIRNGDAVDLTGRTVSDLVAVYRGILRALKSGAKDQVVVTPIFHGHAADFDLETLATEPTPAEDHAVLGKVRKGASLTGAQWERALELMGVPTELVKDGRKLVGFKATLPNMGEATTYVLKYGALTLADEPDYSDKNGRAEYTEAVKAVRSTLVSLACTALGVEDPNARAGLPQRARDYRTDLSIRTCPVCFRDIKASGHTHGMIADHGYTINPGYRVGSCTGSGCLPWEKSCEPAVNEITLLIEYATQVEAELLALTSGNVTSLKARGAYNWEIREYDGVVLTPADGNKWNEALNSAIRKAHSTLSTLWGTDYSSIPWMRMAVRTWKPVSDDHCAVGAPSFPTIESDFEGKPSVL